MTTAEEADAWIGRVAIDSSGRKIGRITRVWIDDYSGLPTWATLQTGRLHRHEGIAPLSQVATARGRQQLGCQRAEVASAPRINDGGHLGLDDEWRLINHYNPAGSPDPTRGDACRGWPENTRRLRTSTNSCPESPPPGLPAAGSAGPAEVSAAGSGEPSGRLFLPGIRRMLGLA